MSRALTGPLSFGLLKALASPEGVGGRFFEQAATVIATGEDGINVTGGWGGISDGALSVESVNVRRPGHSVLKALATAGASDRFMSFMHKVPPVALSGNLEVWLWLPPLSAGGREIIITYSSDTPANDPPTSNPTNRRSFTFSQDKLPSSGWFCLQPHRDGKVYSASAPSGTGWTTTGSPDINEIEIIRVYCYYGSATPDAERYLLLDQVAVNGRGRPCIMLGFDSAAQNHVDVGLPLFQARGLKGYNAIDYDQMASNRSKISPLHDAGWDIISQGGPGHINYLSSPSSLAAAVTSGQAELISEGYPGALDIFMYPQNARSAANDTVAAANGIRMGVASTQQMIPASSLGKMNLVGLCGRMPTDGVGVTFTGRWKAWVDECVLSGKSLIFYGHDLVTTPTDANLHTSIAEFTELLDYVTTLRDAGTVDVVTPSQYLARFGA